MTSTPTPTATGTLTASATQTANATRSPTALASATPTPDPNAPSIEILSSGCSYAQSPRSPEYIYQKHSVTIRLRGPVGAQPSLYFGPASAGCGNLFGDFSTGSGGTVSPATPTVDPNGPSIEILSAQCSYAPSPRLRGYLYQLHTATFRVRGPVGVQPYLHVGMYSTGCGNKYGDFEYGDFKVCDVAEPCLTCDNWTGGPGCPEGNGGIRQSDDPLEATCTYTSPAGQDYGADSFLPPGTHSFSVRFYPEIGVGAVGQMTCPAP
jgi:hypothetical protein